LIIPDMHTINKTSSRGGPVWPWRKNIATIDAIIWGEKNPGTRGSVTRSSTISAKSKIGPRTTIAERMDGP